MDQNTKTKPPTNELSAQVSPEFTEDIGPEHSQLLDETQPLLNQFPHGGPTASQDKNICKICKNEAELSGMIACDSCDYWYHFKCQNIRRKPNEENDWYCKECKQKLKSVKPTVQMK